MPPKHVGEELRDLVKNIRDGTFEYKNRDKSEINWAKYDYAQIKEMADYLNNMGYYYVSCHQGQSFLEVVAALHPGTAEIEALTHS